MHFRRSAPLFAVLVALLAENLPAQKKKPASDDEGYIPVVAPETKQKKKKDEGTQTLPPPKELPGAVTADTERLAFGASPLIGKGLLSQQTRDALKALLKTNHGTIVKLRAFVAGSGDLRRVGELVAETFSEKHLPLPVLSVVQVGALPMEGAQVVLESIEVDKRVVNPHGVAFLAGQNAPSVAQSLARLTTALSAGGMHSEDALRVTCFVSSLDEQRDAHQLMMAAFPGAVLNYLQMQREPVMPAAECEAVARLRTSIAQPVSFLNPPDLDKSPNYSQLALVRSPKLVITGTQLAFGSQEADIKLAFERLQRVLSSSDARFDQVVMSHAYVTSSAIIPRVRTVRASYYSSTTPPASTLLSFQGLPSLDAAFGVDVIAATDSPTARR
ncbi:MAG TPA: RidA family protein [Bryobacteraceae bacterium]|jgi:enamine deaminase RidA (YjgF/YER057c/UK114 family)|nr:RidA family protein [Bryobacteraceae bacterium]